MDISIIIRTYNEEKYLSQVLETVFSQADCPDFEVIVVDSGSTDHTLKIANDFRCKIVSIKKEEFSFGRSLNLGCSNAQGEFLVLVSAHCIPTDKFWLKNLIKPFENPAIALTYGRQLGVEQSKFSEKQLFKKYFPERDANPQEGFFCNNANSCLRKDAWDVRPFDEDLTGLEDMDWAKFQVAQGSKMAYIAEAAVYHIHEETWSQVKRRYEREAFALKDIMPEVHVSFFDMLRYIIVAIFLDAKQALNQRIFFKTWLEICFFRIYQYLGTYTGNHLHRKISKKKKEQYFYPR
ncbi:WcaA Glycosyltransferases involved in cell wall biogenesis [Spirosomataceae bacterium]